MACFYRARAVSVSIQPLLTFVIGGKYVTRTVILTTEGRKNPLPMGEYSWRFLACARNDTIVILNGTQ